MLFQFDCRYGRWGDPFAPPLSAGHTVDHTSQCHQHIHTHKLVPVIPILLRRFHFLSFPKATNSRNGNMRRPLSCTHRTTTTTAVCWLLFTWWTVSDAVVASTTPTTPPPDWSTACRAQGWDPSQLACTTCDLLPVTMQSSCRTCCQSYKDVSRITKPYAAAVLVVPESAAMGGSGDLSEFVTHDWDALVQTKGSKVLQKQTQSRGGAYGFFAAPAVLYFFNAPLPTKALSATDLNQRAEERIYVDGWKRDEIRDMLESLLP